MDPLSHVLTGVVISEAGFRRRIGRSANWLAALAAFSPDLDTLVRRFTTDPWAGMTVHRGATHSLLTAPLIALLWAGLFYAVRRKQFRPMFALACLAVVSHGLLDWITTYGTQILWPIPGRFALDLLPIIDIVFTPILLATVVGCWLARRIAASKISEPAAEAAGRIASRDEAQRADASPSSLHETRAPQRIGRIGLALALAYVAAGGGVDLYTAGLARATAPPGHGAALQVRSAPLLGTILARRLAVRTPEGFWVARYNVLRTPGGPRWTWAPSADGPDVPDVARADRLDHIRLFRWFAMGMARPAVDRATDDAGRPLVRVTYYDMRYGMPADSTESTFRAEVVFDAAGRVVYGPARSHWRRAGAGPEGVLAHFQSQGEPPVRGRRGWARIAASWHEAWRP